MRILGVLFGVVMFGLGAGVAHADDWLNVTEPGTTSPFLTSYPSYASDYVAWITNGGAGGGQGCYGPNVPGWPGHRCSVLSTQSAGPGSCAAPDQHTTCEVWSGTFGKRRVESEQVPADPRMKW